jgi:hypothetical protein
VNNTVDKRFGGAQVMFTDNYHHKNYRESEIHSKVERDKSKLRVRPNQVFVEEGIKKNLEKYE